MRRLCHFRPFTILICTTPLFVLLSARIPNAGNAYTAEEEELKANHNLGFRNTNGFDPQAPLNTSDEARKMGLTGHFGKFLIE